MHFIDNSYAENFYQSKIFDFYFKDLNIGVIDIETTGLNPEKDKMVLGGVLNPINSGVRVRQFFSESPAEEPMLLDAFVSELNHFDILISYNGDHFDIPFINRRLRANNRSKIENNLPHYSLGLHQSFDLYRMLHGFSSLRKLLPNLKQKTVENYLGLWQDRTDEISGAESVDLYYQYLSTRSPSLRDTIMLHNMDDVLQLSRLLKILDKLDLHKIMFYSGFLVSKLHQKLLIKKIEIKREYIHITGLHKNINMDYRHYGVSHEARISKDNGDFSLKIPFQSERNYSYVDLEEFVEDCSLLEKYPSFQSGYLIIKKDIEINYGEINHLIKIILKEILEEL